MEAITPNAEDIIGALKTLIRAIGEDPDREGLIGTPDRIMRMWKEIFRGYDPAQKPKITTFANEEGMSDIVFDCGDYYSMCEHHILPFFGRYYFAYIPSPKGRILGISKVARVVGYCAARLQLQERLARDIVHEDYPDAVIELVDTLAASAGEGMVVYDAVARRDAGMAIDENAAYTRAHLQEYAHWFTVDDLHFLKRGGRCSPSAAFFGTMLKIKPVLHVDSEGRLIARSKVRGRMQALRAIAMKFGELEADKDQMIFISHGDCEKDAMVVKETLVKEFGCDPERIILSAVGPVIGSHSGPGTVALFFRGKDRG